MSQTNSSKFDFYEVVEILEPEVMPTRLWHTKGVVMGMSQSENGAWEYAISVFEDQRETWQLEEEFLKTTGKRMSREDFYDGSFVRIVVDPVTEEGRKKL
jgi:hypothetical protein